MNNRFQAGETLRVANGSPPGHLRTPAFVRGRTGVIIKHFGQFANPERLAYGLNGLPKINLYQVLFTMDETWRGNGKYASNDSLTADIYETWLEPL